MERYLIDTNVVSDYLAAALPLAGMQFMNSVIDAIPNLSVITQIELLCWNTDETTAENVKNFITDSIVLDISSDVIICCVIIRKGKKIKIPDAIIAATALAYNLTLVSNNERDFKNIEGLRVVNPHKM
jgi:predicted nucleic acid-binding protein